MIDPKELTEFTGITAETSEDFKTQFNEKYVLKDKAAEDPTVKTKVSGAILGSEMTNFYRTAKEKGIEFDAEEKKAISKNEDLFSLTLKKFEEKIQGTYVNKIAELEKTAGHGSDEKVKAIMEEKEKVTNRLKEVEAAWKQTGAELETERANGQSTLKIYKVETLLGKAKEPLKIKQNLSEVEKIGLETAIKNELKFDLNDKGELETFNSKGERIISKQKAGDFLGATDALQELVNRLGLAAINPHGGKPAPATGGSPGFRQPEQPTGQTILIGGKPVKV